MTICTFTWILKIFSRGYILLKQKKVFWILKKIFFFPKSLRSQLHLIIYADHYEKTIIKYRKNVHKSKKQRSQPFQCFLLRQSLFAYFPLFTVVVFLTGVRDEKWWALPGNKRVCRGSARLVRFLSTRFVCGFFMRCVKHPDKKKIHLNNLPWRTCDSLSSVRLIIFCFVYRLLFVLKFMQIR